jgi:hypothetical protein
MFGIQALLRSPIFLSRFIRLRDILLLFRSGFNQRFLSAEMILNFAAGHLKPLFRRRQRKWLFQAPGLC